MNEKLVFGIYDRKNCLYGGYDFFICWIQSKIYEKYVDSGKPYRNNYYFSSEEKMNNFYDKILKGEQ